MGFDCQSHAPAALPSGKTRHPLYKRLGGPQCQDGGCKNPAPTVIQSPGRRARSQLLYRLQYTGPRSFKQVWINTYEHAAYNKRIYGHRGKIPDILSFGVSLLLYGLHTCTTIMPTNGPSIQYMFSDVRRWASLLTSETIYCVDGQSVVYR